MEVAMVSVFSGTMGSLLAKLAALLEKDFKLAMGAKKDIEFLRDEMSSINALLLTLSEMEEAIMDALHRDLRDKVRELAYDMEDCLDISMHRLGNPIQTGLLRELKTLGARHQTATLIRALRARVEELPNRQNWMIQLPERRSATVRVDPRIQALYADAASLQGIDGPRHKLVELLQDGAPELKVVPIVGFGGVGKTTLAKQVYTAIQAKYACTAFVSVPRNPDLAKILSTILDQFIRGYHASRDDDENKLINLLRGHLHDKRLKPLNDLDSRILFHKRIFPSEDACPEHLKSISNEILKKCGGLPLAILTIGSILANHEQVGSVEIWEKIINSFRFQLETSQALEWLRYVFDLGYNSLSLQLKTCMLYLAIFPEDYKIVKDDLLRRWIGEGFVTEKHGGDLQEEIAESYFNELVNRNMIQIAEFDDCEEVFSCQIHDLMRDYVILKCTEENFVTIINDQHSTKGPLDVRRLSLHVKSSESSDELGNMALTQARSFNLWGPAGWLPCLTKFQLVRVLHLDIYGSNKDMKYDMSCVGSLFRLRYLRTRGFCSQELLTQLRKLKQLKTLDIASDQEGLSVELDARMLPSTLSHLILGYGKLAGEMGHLRDLRTLSCKLVMVPVMAMRHNDMGIIKEIGELTNLRELKLWILLFAEDSSDVLLSSLCRLCSLRSLTMDGGGLKEDVLVRWSPPPRHLRRLHALYRLSSSCLFSTVPADWIAQLSNLSSLEMQVRSLSSDGADALARLTLLLHLRLHVKEDVPPEGVVVFRRAGFPSLREFWFRWEAPFLAFEPGTMPRLRSLHIDCYERGELRTEGVLDGIEHLGSLVEFKVHVYVRKTFDSPIETFCSVTDKVEDEHGKCDGGSLQAALKEAISKHPGSLRVVIETR